MATHGIGQMAGLARRVNRRVLARGALAAGAVVVVLSAAPAGALSVPANVNYPAPSANNTIVGSGGSASYQLMQALDTLFNDVPGCVITSGSVSGAPSKASQQLDYSCEKSTATTGGTSGGATLEQVPGVSYLDNPINDVAYEEPPTGSANGIVQLELGRNQAGTGIGTAFTGSNPQNVAAINYARSSRDPSTSQDIEGLNFVAYAKDGVAPLIFTEFNGLKTLWGKVVAANTGLTTAQLQGIFNGSIYDWGQIPGVKTSAPIFVYSAQEGSGTQSTFKTFLGFDPSSPSESVNCTDPVAPGTKVATTASKTDPVPTFETESGGSLVALTPTRSTCLGPDVIFANETASILANASSTTEDPIAAAWQKEQLNANASPVGNSIDYYPFGTFNLQCEGLKEQVQYFDKSKGPLTNTKAGADCGSTPLPTGASADRLALAPVNSVVPNAATIINSSYPIPRFLYNVSSNGENPNIPEATAATLNYVSEIGFLCKSQTIDGTANDVASNEIFDPTTGVWYHHEIYSTIIANGFIPINATEPSGDTGFGDLVDGPPSSENAAAGTQTAYSLLSAPVGSSTYGATYLSAPAPGQSTNTSISTSADPVGYCVLSGTDANPAT